MAAKARFLVATLLCLSAVAASAFDVPSVAFDEGFSPLFGDDNLVRSRDDRSVRLLLDRRSGNPSVSLRSSPSIFVLLPFRNGSLKMALFCAGSGFISSDYYLHGFFSASIKLPRDYTAGVVVAFYVSAPSSTLIGFCLHYFDLTAKTFPSQARLFSAMPLFFRAVGSCLVTWACQRGLDSITTAAAAPRIPATPLQVVACAHLLCHRASNSGAVTWAV